MANVVGVFYVLVIGALLSLFYGIVEFTLENYKDAKKRKVCEQFVQLLLKIINPTKPLNII